MKEIIKNTLLLFVITLVAGALLGLVYKVTEAPREEQAIKSRNAAYQAVFEDAESFEDYSFDVDAFAESCKKQADAAGVPVDSSVAKVTGIVEAKSASGETLGYVYNVESYKGYGGTITFTVGIRNDGTVNGYSILSISETAGLGMKAKEDAFASQFAGKNVDFFNYTKTGAAAPNEVDAISGATKTTKAMTYGVDAAIFAHNDICGKGDK